LDWKAIINLNLSVGALIDEKNEPISAREIRQLLQNRFTALFYSSAAIALFHHDL